MKESDVSSIVEEYDRIRFIYETYTQKMESLIKDLISYSGIPVHSVTSRTKKL